MTTQDNDPADKDAQAAKDPQFAADDEYASYFTTNQPVPLSPGDEALYAALYPPTGDPRRGARVIRETDPDAGRPAFSGSARPPVPADFEGTT